MSTGCFFVTLFSQISGRIPYTRQNRLAGYPAAGYPANSVSGATLLFTTAGVDFIPKKAFQMQFFLFSFPLLNFPPLYLHISSFSPSGHIITPPPLVPLVKWINLLPSKGFQAAFSSILVPKMILTNLKFSEPYSEFTPQIIFYLPFLGNFSSHKILLKKIQIAAANYKLLRFCKIDMHACMHIVFIVRTRKCT